MVIGEEIRVDVGVFLKRGHSGDTRAFITPSLVGVGAKNANSIWGEGVLDRFLGCWGRFEGCFLALEGLGDVGVFWGCWGSFKWCLECFEGIIGGVLGAFYGSVLWGVGGVWVCWGYNHSC